MLENLKHKTVLLLEDNREFAENMTFLLETFVKKVHHAYNFAQADEIIVTHTIDIFISDIQLKLENGFDFIRQFRAKDTLTPILIISGHKDEEFLFQAIPLNLTAYLLKPIKYHELIEALSLCSEKLLLDSNPLRELKEGWLYDQKLQVVLKGDEVYQLNKKEALFMELVAKNPKQLITKEMLNAYVWKFEDMSDSAVTNFIMRIRKRFGKSFIYTIPDLGYRLQR